jgi:hypothetical protein
VILAQKLRIADSIRTKIYRVRRVPAGCETARPAALAQSLRCLRSGVGMSHHDGHQQAVTDSRAAVPDAAAGRPQAAGEDRPAAPQPGGGERPGLGGLWLLLVPLACCAGRC